MANELKGKRIAAMVTDGFEQVELFEPRRALEQAGAQVEVIAPAGGEVRGWNHKEWGESTRVDRTLEEVSGDEFDGLLLPGGVINPDKLRTIPAAVEFVRRMFEAGKPVAALCHGPWTLVEAGLVRGFRVTSWPSLRTDLTNAGANWVDQEVVVDRGLVTSRKPDDIPAFNRKMIEEFAEGQHGGGGRREPARAHA
jgi:protease I